MKVLKIANKQTRIHHIKDANGNIELDKQKILVSVENVYKKLYSYLELQTAKHMMESIMFSGINAQ